MNRFLTFIFLVLLPAHTLSPGLKPLLVIWNIGQGQWVTIITETTCHHFDMGGEHQLPPVQRWCTQRRNDLHVSHSDLDHIKFIPWGVSHLPYLCMAAPPLDKTSPRKKMMLARVPACDVKRGIEKTGDIDIRELTHFKPGAKSSGHNELSRVFIVNTPDGAVVIPGDSTIEAEEVWRHSLRANDHVRILVLGHHGSRTSTGDGLLNNLPELRLSIASARRARYGHPHAEVVYRTLSRGIAVLSTEISGHTAIRL